LVAYGDFLIPFDLHKNCEKAQACVPHDDFFFTTLDDLRVDQRPGSAPGSCRNITRSETPSCGAAIPRP
jgi:hypothetical protein